VSTVTAKILINFGKAIRQIRLEKHISQEELADMCGLHRTYLSDVELGKRNISLENIEKLANSLGLSVAELFQVVESKSS